VGKPFTENRITALRHDVRTAEVQGDDVRLQPGLSFTLTGHPRDNLNEHWRVNTVTHKGIQLTSLQEEATSSDASTRYEQTAVLVPGRTEWRPAPLAKPRIDGPHMATVVGPKGEEIYCDEWGRVKVSFPWDRESQNNEFSSCWVRVSQGWAGGSWGSMAIPRIGQDVIIQYVNSDPDQPMITGRTYCGDQLPPYDLPDHKTRMTIKSQTHKGDGFNELRFEDELGRQEVFIHAEKDQNNVVKHNETTFVGNDRSERVDHNETISIGDHRTEDVGKNETISIGANRSVTIGANKTETIKLAKAETIGLAKALTIGAGYQVSVGAAMNTTVGLSQSEAYKKMSETDKKKYLKEYARQLKRQEDAINNMSAKEFSRARGLFNETKRKTGDSGRNPLADKAQRDYRRDRRKEIEKSIYESKRTKNIDPKSAKAEAKLESGLIMEKLAALHEPDMIAGGWAKPDPTGLGDKRINSAIGGNWGHKGRIETIERAATRAMERGEGTDMMNVELTICPPDKKGK